MQHIAIVDYGMGNVRSVQKAINLVSPDDYCFITKDCALIDQADRIIFPGQGAMGSCMSALNENNLKNTIKKASLEKPFLGICLGMHILFDSSEENNNTKGLSILAGTVKKLPYKKTIKIPHMGWNKVYQKNSHPIWHKIDDGSYFYSVHSYYVETQNCDIVAGVSKYNIEFTSATSKDNIFAVQFHPEKSQKTGLRLLKNFVNWKN